MSEDKMNCRIKKQYELSRWYTAILDSIASRTIEPVEVRTGPPLEVSDDPADCKHWISKQHD